MAPASGRDLGATEVFLPDDLETFPGWGPERMAERALHVVLECSGRNPAMEAGFHHPRWGSSLALVGAGVEQPSFDPDRVDLVDLAVDDKRWSRSTRSTSGSCCR